MSPSSDAMESRSALVTRALAARNTEARTVASFKGELSNLCSNWDFSRNKSQSRCCTLVSALRAKSLSSSRPHSRSALPTSEFHMISCLSVRMRSSPSSSQSACISARKITPHLKLASEARLNVKIPGLWLLFFLLRKMRTPAITSSLYGSFAYATHPETARYWSSDTFTGLLRTSHPSFFNNVNIQRAKFHSKGFSRSCPSGCNFPIQFDSNRKAGGQLAIKVFTGRYAATVEPPQNQLGPSRS